MLQINYSKSSDSEHFFCSAFFLFALCSLPNSEHYLINFRNYLSSEDREARFY